MSVAEVAWTAILGVWFGLTVLRQFDTAWVRTILSRDLAGILPVWHFFAPTPGGFDYHVVYRDILEDGEVTPWREIDQIAVRPLRSAVWNPEKRTKKALLDVATDCARLQSAESSMAWSTSLPYLVVLNYVTRIRRETRSRKTQFALFVSEGAAEADAPQMLAASGVHRLA